MSDDSIESPKRRKLLAGVGTGIVAYGAGIGATAAQSPGSDEVTATIDNVGITAWEITSIDGDGELAEMGTENPELALRVGTRYTFQNEGGSFHPLAFRGSDNEVLLSQDGQGSFESDSETNWVDEDTAVSFTVTSELADELNNYVCTVHSSMEGSISTIQQSGTDAPANVTMSDQSTGGTSVTVDSARLDEGGFVTIHDSRLTDGEPVASVRGTSEYLEAGSTQNLEVELDDPLATPDTLIAMAHRDTNGNESYDFVSSGGSEDVPYTFDGGPVIDSASVQVSDAAAVRINDQTTNGESVTVDYARLDDGGFVTIHDSSLLDGETVPSVRGSSDPLDAGEYETLNVTLDDPLEESDTLIAMPHRDTNSNESYDFASSGGSEDGPYTNDSGAIVDDAAVQIVDASVSFPRQATASPTFTQSAPTTPGVTVEVTATTESAVVVTYEDGGDLVIAGLGVFSAEELNGEGVVVAVEDAGGFPGEHVAHAIPTGDLSSQYAPGDTVSAETANAVLDNNTATVHQAGLTFEDQTGEGPVESGDAMATLDASLSGDVGYTVDVHVTDDEDSLIAAEWIGSSNVLTGENEGTEIIAERVPEGGEFNELPFSGTDAFVAMIHLAPNASAGDSASPGSGPVVPNVDGEAGVVPGGVTATAAVTAEADGMDDGGDGMDDGGDGMDDGGDGGNNTDNGGDDSSDDSGPGFGPVAGAAGLSGLAAYAYRKLNLDSDPATPEDDDLDDAE